MDPVTKRRKIGIALITLPLTFEDVMKKRIMWAKKWLIERKKFSHIILLKELDSDHFRNYLRMDYDCFNELLNLVSPLILKQNACMRESVSAEERLLATLKYLATGRDYVDNYDQLCCGYRERRGDSSPILTFYNYYSSI